MKRCSNINIKSAIKYASIGTEVFQHFRYCIFYNLKGLNLISATFKSLTGFLVFVE